MWGSRGLLHLRCFRGDDRLKFVYGVFILCTGINELVFVVTFMCSFLLLSVRAGAGVCEFCGRRRFTGRGGHLGVRKPGSGVTFQCLRVCTQEKWVCLLGNGSKVGSRAHNCRKEMARADGRATLLE